MPQFIDPHVNLDYIYNHKLDIKSIGGNACEGYLNPNEWIVMEALWAKSPATLGETIDRIGSRASWNYKTYQSYMNVLEKKGYISSEKRGRDKFYSPAISREECIARESRAVLSKMQSDSVGLMITSMVREGDLSRSDRLELMNMLEKMLKEETENESDR